MKKKENEIKLARDLRSKGMSVPKISKELKVAKSSVSIWVRDVELTDEQKLILKNNIGNTYLENLKGQSEINKNNYAKIRQEYYDQGYIMASTSNYFRNVALLYWAEGTKNRNSFTFCNSDMDMMSIVCCWLNKNIINKKINFYIKYYGENGLSEYQIKRRWIKVMPFLKNKKWLLKLQKQEIARDSQKRGIGKLLYGTASVVVNSTELIQKVYGAITYVKKNIGD